MIKIKAFIIHFAISTFFILNFLAIVFFLWYPSPYLTLEGGNYIIAILIGVDLVLGPILTFVVYKPGKKGLLLDLCIIAFIQVIAFAYGALTIYTERPQYIAFTVDRFILIPASSINTDELTEPSLFNSPFNKPRFVYVDKVKDPKRKKEIILNALEGGKDIERYPEFYRKYNIHFADIIKSEHQLSVNKILDQTPSIKNRVTQIENEFQVKREQLVFYPIKGNEKVMIIVLNKENSNQTAILERLPYTW